MVSEFESNTLMRDDSDSEIMFKKVFDCQHWDREVVRKLD